MKRKSLLICFAVCLISLLVFTVFAHPGKTDGKGGHTSHSTGEYHYHHGYSAHDHYDMDGDGEVDCPYDFDDKTDHTSKGSVTINPKASKPVPSTPSPMPSVSKPVESATQTEKKITISDIIGIGFILVFWAYGSLIISALLGNLICNIFAFKEGRGNIFCYILMAVVFVVGSIIIIRKLYNL